MQGGPNPPQQFLQIWNGGGGILNWQVSSTQPWLTLAPIAGSSTGEIDIVVLSVNIANLLPGTYNATISIVDLAASNNPQEATVTLTVVAPGSGPLIQYVPTTMTFAAPQGGPDPAPQTLLVRNAGSGTLTWNVTDNATWLSLSPTSGASTGEPDSVAVSVSVAGLVAGTYVATISITGNAANSPAYVTVTLTVTTGTTPLIGYNPTAFTFSALQGGSNPPLQVLTVWNAGGGILNWSVSDNAAWLALAPLNGSSTGPADLDTVTLSVNIANMAAGTYNAVVEVSGVGAANSPVLIPVVLTVYPAGSTIIAHTPSTMIFTATTGGSNPAAQTLAIWNGGAGT